MKKLFVFALASLLTLSACGKKADEPKPEAAADVEAVADVAEEQVPKDICIDLTPELVKAMVKDPAKVTEDEYVAMLETYKCCKTTDDLELDKDNCAVHKAIKELKADHAKFPSMGSVVAKLVKHESPVVRGASYSAFDGIIKDDVMLLIKDAIQSEKDLYGMYKLLDNLRDQGNKDPEIGKFLIDMTKHENKFMRRKAIIGLSSVWSNQVEGAVDVLLPLLDDPDNDTAKTVCSGLGYFNDERVIAPIVKILKNKDKSDLHFRCAEALSVMWLDFPNHRWHNEKAYKAYMDYYKQKPRSEKIPDWNAIVVDVDLEKWLPEAKWFKKKDFINVMSDLVKDKDFNAKGKERAIKAIGAFGGKAELTALDKAVKDEGLKNEIAKAMENAE